MRKILLMLAFGFTIFTLNGCSIGANNSQQPTISISNPSASCNKTLTSTNTCSFTVTYNPNGNFLPITLSANSSTYPGIALSPTISSCQNSINTNLTNIQSGTCNMVLTYTTQGGSGTSLALTFSSVTTGGASPTNATSNSIQITGN